MTDYDPLIDLLNAQGWAVSDTAVKPEWSRQLLGTAQKWWRAGRFEPGAFGREGVGGQHAETRGDAICWVQPASRVAEHPFFLWIAQFRQILNARYNLGVRSQEFHFARYPAGAAYKKHIDQHRGVNFRKISLVLYLNRQWNPAHGGELCLYQTYNPDVEIQRFAPLEARLAVFVSGRVPHEVLPCRATRWSLAGWLRTDAPAISAAAPPA